MRTLTIIAALALVATASPAAADGVDASVQYMDEEASCTEREGYWGDSDWQNNSYWYAYSEYHEESCSAEYTYASASVAKDGENLATANATGRDWSHHVRNYSTYASGWWSENYDSYWRSSSGYARGSEGWSRDVTVDTVAGDARASRGCSSTYWEHDRSERNEYSYRWGNESYWYGNEQDSWSYENMDECHDSVTAGDATAAWRGECARHGDWRSWSSSNDGREGTWYLEGSYSRSCFNGATVDAAGENARAGTLHECTWDGARAHTPESESYWSFSEQDCRDGVIVEGPWGASAFLGIMDASWEHCNAEGNATECESSSRRDAGAHAQWEKSPAGPTEYWVYYPLP